MALWSSSHHINNTDKATESLKQDAEPIQKLDHFSGMYLPLILVLQFMK